MSNKVSIEQLKKDILNSPIINKPIEVNATDIIKYAKQSGIIKKED